MYRIQNEKKTSNHIVRSCCFLVIINTIIYNEVVNWVIGKIVSECTQCFQFVSKLQNTHSTHSTINTPNIFITSAPQSLEILVIL